MKNKRGLYRVTIGNQTYKVFLTGAKGQLRTLKKILNKIKKETGEKTEIVYTKKKEVF